MPSELVTRMRAKYPTEYSDLSDSELESKILAKYPEYKDLASKPAETPAAPSGASSDALSSLAPIAGAYAAGKVLPSVLPMVNQAAKYVAANPQAQKLVGSGLMMAAGASRGAVSGLDLAAEAILGSSIGGIVGAGAKKLATFTGPVRARAANGQFTKLAPSALKSVLEKLGPAMGLMQSESDVLSRLNTPEQLAKLKATK